MISPNSGTGSERQWDISQSAGKTFPTLVRAPFSPCRVVVGVLDELVHVDVPLVQPLGVGGQQVVKHGLAPLRLAETELQLRELADHLHVCGRGGGGRLHGDRTS